MPEEGKGYDIVLPEQELPEALSRAAQDILKNGVMEEMDQRWSGGDVTRVLTGNEAHKIASLVKEGYVPTEDHVKLISEKCHVNSIMFILSEAASKFVLNDQMIELLENMRDRDTLEGRGMLNLTWVLRSAAANGHMNDRLQRIVEQLPSKNKLIILEALIKKRGHMVQEDEAFLDTLSSDDEEIEKYTDELFQVVEVAAESEGKILETPYQSIKRRLSSYDKASLLGALIKSKKTEFTPPRVIHELENYSDDFDKQTIISAYASRAGNINGFEDEIARLPLKQQAYVYANACLSETAEISQVEKYRHLVSTFEDPKARSNFLSLLAIKHDLNDQEISFVLGLNPDDQLYIINSLIDNDRVPEQLRPIIANFITDKQIQQTIAKNFGRELVKNHKKNNRVKP